MGTFGFVAQTLTKTGSGNSDYLKNFLSSYLEEAKIENFDFLLEMLESATDAKNKEATEAVVTSLGDFLRKNPAATNKTVAGLVLEAGASIGTSKESLGGPLSVMFHTDDSLVAPYIDGLKQRLDGKSVLEEGEEELDYASHLRVIHAVPDSQKDVFDTALVQGLASKAESLKDTHEIVATISALKTIVSKKDSFYKDILPVASKLIKHSDPTVMRHSVYLATALWPSYEPGLEEESKALIDSIVTESLMPDRGNINVEGAQALMQAPVELTPVVCKSLEEALAIKSKRGVRHFASDDVDGGTRSLLFAFDDLIKRENAKISEPTVDVLVKIIESIKPSYGSSLRACSILKKAIQKQDGLLSNDNYKRLIGYLVPLSVGQKKALSEDAEGTEGLFAAVLSKYMKKMTPTAIIKHLESSKAEERYWGAQGAFMFASNKPEELNGDVIFSLALAKQREAFEACLASREDLAPKVIEKAFDHIDESHAAGEKIKQGLFILSNTVRTLPAAIDRSYIDDLKKIGDYELEVSDKTGVIDTVRNAFHNRPDISIADDVDDLAEIYGPENSKQGQLIISALERIGMRNEDLAEKAYKALKAIEVPPDDKSTEKLQERHLKSLEDKYGFDDSLEPTLPAKSCKGSEYLVKKCGS